MFCVNVSQKKRVSVMTDSWNVDFDRLTWGVNTRLVSVVLRKWRAAG